MGLGQCVIPTVEADTGLAVGRGLWTFAAGRRTVLYGPRGHNSSTDDAESDDGHHSPAVERWRCGVEANQDTLREESVDGTACVMSSKVAGRRWRKQAPSTGRETEERKVKVSTVSGQRLRCCSNVVTEAGSDSLVVKWAGSVLSGVSWRRRWAGGKTQDGKRQQVSRTMSGRSGPRGQVRYFRPTLLTSWTVVGRVRRSLPQTTTHCNKQAQCWLRRLTLIVGGGRGRDSGQGLRIHTASWL